MNAAVGILLCVLALGGIALGGVAGARRPATSHVVYGAALVACLAALFIAGAHLLAAAPPAIVTLPLGLPWIGARIRLDALSAFFLVVVNLGGAATSLYGIGYGTHEATPHRVLPFFPAFVAGMNLVVVADDAFTFLFAWEFMSLMSWALVMAHHRDEENARAGYVYLLMASFGTLALLLTFGLLAGFSGAYAFADIRVAEHTPLLAGLAFVLALIGTGSKAGLVPLHVWLPLAHPVAPSHVSALLSGVMTKVAVYAFVRIAFDLLGVVQWWSGLVVLAVAGITAVLGVLYALMQHDLKRLLAYHTIENIGIIFVGLGLALAFQANALTWAASLALTAALLHTLNHSLFKALLFFGAGAVLTTTGERNLDHLGGLIHRMPVTSVAFLVGCAAISALPPLNGFVSEWLTFQAILQSPPLPQWGLRIMVPTVGGLLALAAALAAACFVKVFGVAFLGRPRTPAAAAGREVDGFSLAGMLVLALLCFVGGVLPGLFIDALAPVTSAFAGAAMPPQLAQPWLTIVPVSESRSSYNGLVVFLFIAAAAMLTAATIHRFGSRAVRRTPAWDCGFPVPSPLSQYTGDSFAQPIRRVFATGVFRAREYVDMPLPGDVRPAHLKVEIHDLIWEAIYTPVAATVGAAATQLNRLQFLTIRRYLTLVFFALVSLLLVSALWP